MQYFDSSCIKSRNQIIESQAISSGLAAKELSMFLLKLVDFASICSEINEEFSEKNVAIIKLLFRT